MPHLFRVFDDDDRRRSLTWSGGSGRFPDGYEGLFLRSGGRISIDTPLADGFDGVGGYLQRVFYHEHSSSR